MIERTGHRDIRIGLCLPLERADWAGQLAAFGFESFSLNQVGGLKGCDWQEQVRIAKGTAPVSCIGLYGNLLTDSDLAADLVAVVKGVRPAGVTVVGCFTGANPHLSVGDNMNAFVAGWSEIARVAEGEGVMIAFENCPMGGDWARPTSNLAFTPRAWELLFDAVNSPALGLQWEPAHALCAMADPMRQVERWSEKIWHVHGKDAAVLPDKLADHGVNSDTYAIEHRLPGFGDSNWAHMIGRLRQKGWTGSIDIEGFHDKTLSGDLEATGWVASLRYLQACRGGEFVPNLGQA